MSQQFCERQNLCRITATQFKELFHQHWFVDVRRHQHIFPNGRSHQRIFDILAPSLFVTNHRCSPWITAKINILIERKSESIVHLLITPMPQTNQFKTSCQRFGEPFLNQQTTAPQQHHFQIDLPARVFVPFTLHHLTPVVYLLHLVNHKDSLALSTELHRGARTLPHSAYPITVFGVNSIGHFHGMR